MKAKEKTRMRSLAVAGAAAFVLFCGNARGQVTQQQMPPRVRTQVSGQQTPQQRALKPAPLKNITDYSGKISGVVYWDTTKVVRNTEATLVDLENKTETTVAVPPGCDGTAVYVWITDQTAQWGAWQASTSTLSYSVDGSLARCAYTIDRVPTGQALSVAAYVPSEDYSFKTGMTNYGDMAAVPAPGDKATWWYTWGGGVGGVGTSITVVNTPCRDLISSTSISSASGPRSCGGQATNVNFIIGSYSGYLNSLFSSSGGSSQQLSAIQARAVPQTVRLRQTPSRGALTTQSPRPTKAAAGGQQISVLPSNAPLTNPGPQQTPMLGTPAEPLLANGSQPGTPAAQTPGATSANPASGERTTMSAAGATVTRAALTPTNGGSQPGAAPIPSKGHEKNAYEAVTTHRGTTNDPTFTNWANAGQQPHGVNSQSVAEVARTTALTSAFVGLACAKDPSFRILGVSGAPDGITLTTGPQYTIWGCSFGNPPNSKTSLPSTSVSGQPAPMQSQAGEQSRAFIWTSNWLFYRMYFKVKSWTDNSIVITLPAPASVITRPTGVSMHVSRADGQETSKDGFTYAPPPPPPPPGWVKAPAPTQITGPAAAPSPNESCSQDDTFRIQSVVPDYPGYLGLPQIADLAVYTIFGCGFGSNQGSLYLSGGGSAWGGYFSVKFHIQQWSDTYVVATFSVAEMQGFRTEWEQKDVPAVLTVYRSDKKSTVLKVSFYSY